MQERKQKSSFPWAWFAGIAGIILIIGGGTAWWAKHSLNNNAKAPVTKQLPATKTPETTLSPKQPVKEEQQQIQIGWLDTTGSNVKLATKTITVPQSLDRQQVLTKAFEQLLAGPDNDAEYTSTIPQGTKLLSLQTTEEGVKVDLSQEFIDGGGSAAMSARLAQVLYTASSLEESTPVWISVEGKPLANLGGEGITVSQPMTRQEFETNFNL